MQAKPVDLTAFNLLFQTKFKILDYWFHWNLACYIYEVKRYNRFCKKKRKKERNMLILMDCFGSLPLSFGNSWNTNHMWFCLEATGHNYSYVNTICYSASELHM